MNDNIERNIIAAATFNEWNTVLEIKDDILRQRCKLDKWFDRYLNMFEEKLQTCKSTDPVKVLFKRKSDEYEHVNRLMRVVEFYLSKAHQC